MVVCLCESLFLVVHCYGISLEKIWKGWVVVRLSGWQGINVEFSLVAVNSSAFLYKFSAW